MASRAASRRPIFAGWFIFALALAVRLGHLGQIHSSPFGDFLMGDARGYDAWAQQIAAGDWLGHDVFYQAPLYPYLLGAFYSLVGRHLMLVRLAQALLSAGASVMLAAAGRRLFSPRAGLIAGLGLALSAPSIFADGLVQKSSLDLFLVCVGLWVLSVLITRPGRGLLWLTLGAVVGALTLTRENSAILLIPLLTWIAIDHRIAYRARVSGGAYLLLGTVVLLAPVAIRNAVVGHGLYPTTAQFGPNLYIGNHPGASGVYEPLRPGRSGPEFERRDATDIAETAVGRKLTPGEVSRYWTAKSLAFFTDHPTDWAMVTGRKLLLLLNGSEIPDTESQASHAEWSSVLAVLGPVSNFGVLIPIACLGAWIMRRRWRELWILPALVVTYAIGVVAFFVLDRYRFPLIPFLILFGAAGLAEWSRTWRLALPRERIITAAAMLAMVVTTNWPLFASNSRRALTENMLGAALQEGGRPDEARAHFQAAVALDGSFLEGYFNLGTTSAATGRPGEARAAFEKVVSLEPESAMGHYWLGKTLLQQDKTADGIAHLRNAVRLMPGAEEYHTGLGAALVDQGMLDEAIAEFREAVRLAPGIPQTHWNLGLALQAAGASHDAVAALERAVELSKADGALRADLARALFDVGEVEAAVREFKTSVALTPATADTLNRLGVALAKSGDVPGAIDSFRASLAIEGDFDDARRNLETASRITTNVGR